MEISPRLTRWINHHFPKGTAEMVLSELRDLPDQVLGRQDPERIHAALVIRTAGSWHRFQQHLTLAKTDWRDALVAADLANQDWPTQLDALLGANK
ncbi:hypothetical protein [Kribbella speibonae]|uniref:Uncharacterized protein n=1 Tax=Kribbella speibonae TaxID=1572660 RepID=A0ABY2A3B7_9ACTN|nr:hypothetical protein [Kribbella speibonae]TCC20992.1 hypothetical protein E0H58_27050 [Kribbella speibonae]